MFYYIRIFAVTRASVTFVLLAAFTVFTALWTVAFFFTALFHCKGQFLGNHDSAKDIAEKCPGTTTFAFSVALTDFVTDVIIMLIPFPLVSF